MSCDQVIYYYNEDGDYVQVPQYTVGVDKPATYPAEWFEANPNLKPPITIQHPKPRNQVDATVIQNWHDGHLDVNVAMLFIRDAFSKTFGTLIQDWKSFNRVIGLQHSRITLDDLVTFQESEEEVRLMDGAEMNDRDRLRYLVCFAGIYRVHNISHHDYQVEVMVFPDQSLTSKERFNRTATG